MENKAFWKGFKKNTQEPPTRTTYKYDAECCNCGYVLDVKIPKKVLAKEFLKGRICDNCRCEMV